MVRRTPITELEEYQIVLLRVVLFLSLDDLVKVVQAKINPSITRASINRCLKRCHVDSLDWLIEKIARLKDKTEYGRKLVDKNGEPLNYKSLSSSYRNFPFLVCYELTHHSSNIAFFFYVQPALKMVVFADVCSRKNLEARKEAHKQYLHGLSFVVLSAEHHKNADIFDLIYDNLPKKGLLQDHQELKRLKAHFFDLKPKIAGYFFPYRYKWLNFYTEVFDFVDDLKLPYSTKASRKEEACSDNIFCHLLKSGAERFPIKNNAG